MDSSSNTTITLFLYNGTQSVAHFPKAQLPTVQDLIEFVDRASGIPSETYSLVQISPYHKKLENQFDSLSPSTVVQVKEGTSSDQIFAAEASPAFPPSLSPANSRAKISHGSSILSRGNHYEQIMLAFMFTATNLVGFALVALLYFNLVMFWPYITPFFFAIVVGLTLRTPRDKIVKYLAPLASIEIQSKNLPIIYFRKTKFILIACSRNVVNVFVGTVFLLILGLLYILMLGSWKPVVIGFFVILFLLIAFLILLSPPTFAAILLLTALFLTIGTLAIFSTTSFIHEMFTLLQLLEPHIKYLSQKKFETDAVLEIFGIGHEYRSVFASFHDVVLTKLTETAGEWGWNITNFGNFTNFSTLSNLTDLATSDDLFNKYDYSTVMDLVTGSWGVATRNVFVQLSGWAFGTSFYMVKVLAQFSTSFYNLLISITVFVTALYLMLVSNKNWISELLRMVPMTTISTRSSVDNQIKDAFTGIVLTTFVTCAVNAVMTYLIVAYGANFIMPFMYTFANALLTLFPVAYPWVLHVLLVANLYWTGQWIRGATVTTEFIILAVIDTGLYSYLSPSSLSSSSTGFPHQWVSGLSVVMGLYAFGMQGILMGPVLVYLTIILYKAFVDALRDPRSSSLVDVLTDTSRRGSSFVTRNR